MIKKYDEVIVAATDGSQKFSGTVLEVSLGGDVIVFRTRDGKKLFLHTGIDQLDDGDKPLPGRFLVVGYREV